MRLVQAPGPDGAPPWAAAHETTQGAFARFVAETGHVTTAERDGGAKVWRGTTWVMDPAATWGTAFPGPARPVVAISWHDAVAFCEWLPSAGRYRMATSIACRATPCGAPDRPEGPARAVTGPRGPNRGGARISL